MNHSSKTSSLLLMSLMTLTVYASTTSIPQAALTDADKRAILSLLFEAERAAVPNEKELIILLSPRTDPSWIPELPGIRFKRLAYEEERQVSEYFELRITRINRNYGERWKKHGILYLEEKLDRYWHSHLTSEPISLDFQQVQVN
jgi:hypothetical protein